MDSWTGNQESWDLWGIEATEVTLLVLPFVHYVRELNYRLSTFHSASQFSDCRITELEVRHPTLSCPALSCPEDEWGWYQVRSRRATAAQYWGTGGLGMVAVVRLHGCLTRSTHTQIF